MVSSEFAVRLSVDLVVDELHLRFVRLCDGHSVPRRRSGQRGLRSAESRQREHQHHTDEQHFAGKVLHYQG